VRLPHLFSTLLFSLLGASLFAQFNIGYSRFESIPVFKNGSPLPNAWTGGFNNPQFSTIELNGDALPDLFVFDRDGNQVRTFINEGTTGTPSFRHAPEFQKAFPAGLRDFALLRDYNCDGQQDIFAYAGGAFEAYRNTSANGTISFELAAAELPTDYGSIVLPAYIISNDIGGIDDIDGDGDIDLLSFGIGSSESTIEYHQNQSMELYGHCDSLVFDVATRCWGNVEEPGNSNALVSTTCKGVTPPTGKAEHSGHPGSTILPIDMDGDNDMDLILGDIISRRLVYIPNVGDSNSASLNINLQDTLFPSDDVSVDLEFMAAAYHLDVDNDQKRDLLVATNNTVDPSFNTTNVWWYKNNGTEAVPDFEFETNSFLVDEMIDVGSGSHPIFFDASGDGLFDLLVGNDNSRNITGSAPATLTYYRNIGTATNPEFEFVTADYANISSLDLQSIHPTFGDIDNDNVAEMIIGDLFGDLHLFENNPVAGAAQFTLDQANYMGNSIGFNATPQLYDVNNDNLLDLLVGEKEGRIHYFENTGTTAQAVFPANPTNLTFGNIDVDPVCCFGYSVPFMTTAFDSSGTTFLFVSSENGRVFVYGNISGNLTGTFDHIDNLFLESDRTSMHAAPLFGDGLMTLVFGEKAGGLSILKNELAVFPGINTPTSAIDQFSIYPNPFSTQVKAQFELASTQKVSFSLIDPLGRQLWQIAPRQFEKGEHTQQLTFPELSHGIYFLTMQAGSERKVLKVFQH